MRLILGNLKHILKFWVLEDTLDNQDITQKINKDSVKIWIKPQFLLHSLNKTNFQFSLLLYLFLGCLLMIPKLAALVGWLTQLYSVNIKRGSGALYRVLMNEILGTNFVWVGGGESYTITYSGWNVKLDTIKLDKIKWCLAKEEVHKIWLQSFVGLRAPWDLPVPTPLPDLPNSTNIPGPSFEDIPGPSVLVPEILKMC